MSFSFQHYHDDNNYYWILVAIGQEFALRSNQVVFTGEETDIGCVIDTSDEGIAAATEPFNAWTKDSEVISLGGRISLLQLSLSSILTIRDIQPSDEGVYICSRPGFRNLTTVLRVITGGMYS